MSPTPDIEDLPQAGGSYLRNPSTGDLIPLEQPESGLDLDVEAVLAALENPDPPPAPEGSGAQEETP